MEDTSWCLVSTFGEVAVSQQTGRGAGCNSIKRPGEIIKSKLQTARLHSAPNGRPIDSLITDNRRDWGQRDSDLLTIGLFNGQLIKSERFDSIWKCFVVDTSGRLITENKHWL